MKRLVIGMLLGALLIISLDRVSRAQSLTMNFTIASGTTSANCPAPVALQTTYCLTGGGIIYVSISGATYTAYSSGTTAGVTSVNGKTGAVTISATATAPTVTIN